MKVGEICNRVVIVVKTNTSIVEAAALMREYHVGDLVVVQEKDDSNVPIGIITDRDLVIEIIAKEVPIDTVSVGDVMSIDLLLANEDEDMDEVIRKMRDKGVRRIPVVDHKNSLVGIVSVDDLIDLFAERMDNVVSLITREQLRESKLRRVT